jgi:hypothetical protein
VKERERERKKETDPLCSQKINCSLLDKPKPINQPFHRIVSVLELQANMTTWV